MGLLDGLDLGGALRGALGTVEATALPALTDPRIQRIIAAAAHGLGLTSMEMPSGAGHDAQDIARIAPIGMIFVPSVGGISHSPREFTAPADIANGVNVLLRTVLAIDAGELDRQPIRTPRAQATPIRSDAAG